MAHARRFELATAGCISSPAPVAGAMLTATGVAALIDQERASPDTAGVVSIAGTIKP